VADRSLGADYFEDVYARDPDPWRFASSDYERAKYDATIAALGGARFGAGLEIGCSIGVLTARLAAICDGLLAVDLNERALAAARTRCAALPGVRFARMQVPAEFPAERFDLIVVSEVAYYWSDADLRTAIDASARAAAGGGVVELVHWLPVVPDYPRTGDAAHEAFLADPRFERLRGARSERYRIDVLRAA
jgi:SAM-dependent methyltransferase